MNAHNPTKLVIFDVDGTLVDSQNIIVEAQRQCFESLGLPTPTRVQALSVVGLSLREAFARLVGSKGPIDALSQGYKQAFNDLRSDPVYDEPLFGGAKEIIAKLASDESVLLAIATGKSRRGVDHLFERTGWSSLFASVQTADDHPSKPAPDMILAALQETGVTPQQAIMVGDTVFDVEMAGAAGVAAIGVDWGYHKAEDLRAAGAQSILNHFSALEPIVANL